MFECYEGMIQFKKRVKGLSNLLRPITCTHLNNRTIYILSEFFRFYFSHQSMVNLHNTGSVDFETA